jgi:L-amino acid N-acyltransferase YncA
MQALQHLTPQMLERLCNAARDAGYRALYGHILADNRDMLKLAEHLGFSLAGRGGAAVSVVRQL